MNVGAITSVNRQSQVPFRWANSPVSQQRTVQVPLYEDCTNLYTQKEIKNIRESVGAPNFDMLGPSRYSVSLYKSGALVINNENMTNDSLEILADGSVRHVGSWHNNLLGKKDEYKEMIADAKKRLENSKNN